MSGYNATLYVTGFEHGAMIAGQNPDKVFIGAQGDVTVQSSIVRSGGYALKVKPVNGTLTNATQEVAGPIQGSVNGRFYIYFVTLPDANTALFTVGESSGGRNPCGFEWNAATNKLRPYSRNEAGNVDYTGTDCSLTITTGIWYRVDFRITRPTSTTRQFEWSIAEEFAAQNPQTTDTLTAVLTTSFGRVCYGELTDRGGTTIDGEYYFDDVFIATGTYSAGDMPRYPVGDGRVCALRPASDGTHVNSGSFTDSAANSPPSAFFSYVDEVPVTTDTTTDYVKQTTIGAGDYLEANLTDTPADWLDGVYANGAIILAGTFYEVTGVADFTAALYDSVHSFVAATVGLSGTAIAGKAWNWASVFMSASSWENGGKSTYDAMLLRAGLSDDVTPNCRFLDFICEVDYPEAGVVSSKYGWDILL